MKIIAFILTLLVSTLTHATDFAGQLQAMGFSQQVREKPGGIKLDRIHLPFYGVNNDKGQLIVNQGQRTPNGPSFNIDSKRYHYEARDNGEFGGKLIATNKQGKSFTLIKENIRGFFKLNQQIFVLAGLAHHLNDSGRLYRIDESSGKPKLVLITLLTGAPVDVVTTQDRVYVLTRNELEVIRFYKDEISLSIIVHNAPWYSVPANITMHNEEFAIGMHAGVVVVNYDELRKIADVQYFSK